MAQERKTVRAHVTEAIAGVLTLTLTDTLGRDQRFLVQVPLARWLIEALSKVTVGAGDVRTRQNQTAAARWSAGPNPRADWSAINPATKGPNGASYCGLGPNGQVYLALQMPDGTTIELTDAPESFRALARELDRMCDIQQTPTTDRQQ